LNLRKQKLKEILTWICTFGGAIGP